MLPSCPLIPGGLPGSGPKGKKGKLGLAFRKSGRATQLLLPCDPGPLSILRSIPVEYRKVKWRVKFSLNVAESCLPRIVSQLCVLRAEGKFDHVCRNLGSFSGVALGSSPRVSYVPGSDIERWVTDGMLWHACLFR